MAMVCNNSNRLNDTSKQQRSNGDHRSNAIEAEIVSHNAAFLSFNGIQLKGTVQEMDEGGSKTWNDGANKRTNVTFGRPHQIEQGRVTDAGYNNIAPRLTKLRESRIYNGTQLWADKRSGHKWESIAEFAVRDRIAEKPV